MTNPSVISPGATEREERRAIDRFYYQQVRKPRREAAKMAAGFIQCHWCHRKAVTEVERLKPETMEPFKAPYCGVC